MRTTGIQRSMDELPNDSEKKSGRAGPTLFFVMLALILVGIAAFLILRPSPGGGGSSRSGSASPTTSSPH